MRRLSNLRTTASAALLALVSTTASAVPISIADFSGNEQVETFASAPLIPFPSAGNEVSQIHLNGLTYTSADYFMVQEFSGLSLASIPSASGGRAVNTGPAGNFSIDFGNDVTRAGLLLSTSVAFSWTVNALDSNLDVLESLLVSQPAPDQALFVGFEQLSGIRHLEIALQSDNTASPFWFTFFDDVRYETSVQVPEPSTFALLGLGLLGVTLTRRRKRS